MKLELVKCVVRLMSGRDFFFPKKKYCTDVHITKKKNIINTDLVRGTGNYLPIKKSEPLNKSLQRLQNTLITNSN